ncbi:MAG: right-handed parallel beta-helix repeat-containing protein [archaeon]|nr:hypothetical protein [Candidatus Bathyarchaeum sp.]
MILSLTCDLVKANPIPSVELPRIHINSDGTIEPSTVPILQTGNVYTFTGNIKNYSIEVHRNDIILDGAGYMLQSEVYNIDGGSASKGVSLYTRSNVTIQNLEIQHFHEAIRVYDSSNIQIVKNTVTNNDHGVYMLYSSNISVEQNHLTKNRIGILFGACNHISITENLFTKNMIGINADSNPASSFQINIIRNDIIENQETGMASAGTGIVVSGGLDVFIIANNIENNIRGVYLSYTNCTVYHNAFVDNAEQFYGLYSQVDPVNQRSISWDNGTQGNYWSNYKGKDENNDGIGDTPHIIQKTTTQNEPTTNVPITHGVDAQDNFPLMEPSTIPEFPSWTVLLVFMVTATFVAIFKKRGYSLSAT